MSHALVELDAHEAMVLLQIVRGRFAEVERILDGLEEGEGMDLSRHQAIKTLRPQAELLGGIVMKLEGAARELREKR